MPGQTWIHGLNAKIGFEKSALGPEILPKMSQNNVSSVCVCVCVCVTDWPITQQVLVWSAIMDNQQLVSLPSKRGL